MWWFLGARDSRSQAIVALLRVIASSSQVFWTFRGHRFKFPGNLGFSGAITSSSQTMSGLLGALIQFQSLSWGHGFNHPRTLQGLQEGLKQLKDGAHLAQLNQRETAIWWHLIRSRVEGLTRQGHPRRILSRLGFASLQFWILCTCQGKKKKQQKVADKPIKVPRQNLAGSQCSQGIQGGLWPARWSWGCLWGLGH